MGKTVTICFTNNKGGSGKSTTCSNLGAAMARAGKKVLLVDGDMQLNLSLAFFPEDWVLEHAQGEKNLYHAIGRQEDLTDYIVHTPYENLDLVPSSTLMSSIEEAGLSERLSVMMQEITMQGEKLGKHMDVRDMKHYRRLIQEFMNEIVNRSHKFSRENFLDRRGRHRVYGMIKRVNVVLDELAGELIKEEKDTLAILSKVDEIRGLLLDIIT